MVSPQHAEIGGERCRRHGWPGGVLTRLLVGVLLALAVSCGGGDGQAGEATGSTVSDPATTSTTPEVALPVTIVVLGSSTAAGFGLADPASGWVALVDAALARERPGSEVVNLAVPGFSTYQIQADGWPTPAGRPPVTAEHNVTAALALDPDALIVNLPSNDSLIGVPAAEQVANLRAVVAEAETHGVPTWVTTTQPRNLDDSGRMVQIEVRDLVVDAFGDHAIDAWTGLAAPDGTIEASFDSGDGVHLSAEGHAVLADRVLAADIASEVTDR